MPAGKNLMMRVESHLDLKAGKTMQEIRGVVTVGCTPRAIRYAVANLISGGKAVKRGRQIFAAKDLLVHILENAGGDGTLTVPLAECFPDDIDGYLGAKADLLHHGSHEGGGGAAAKYSLKLAEAA